jgi:hypothetical protein
MKRFTAINEIDLHGYYVAEADQLLKDKLDELYRDYPDEFDRLIIIHGYAHGDQLLRYVRGRRDYRVKKIRTVPDNPGITIYDLYSWDELIDAEEKRRH